MANDLGNIDRAASAFNCWPHGSSQGMPRIRVLYVGGFSRSGSTLLAQALGEISGAPFVGELFDVWHRGVVQNCLCGCGERFRACAFWQQVVREGFSREISDLPVQEIQRLRAKVRAYWRIPALGIAMLRTRTHRRQLATYRDVLTRLYLGIQRASGSELIIDSSKVPQYAWLLNEIATLEVHVIHLVRDSRATAHSWRRIKCDPSFWWSLKHIGRRSALRSALEWDAFNKLFELTHARFASYSVIRYEDFAADPLGTLQRLARTTGSDWAGSSAVDRATLNLHASHSAFGNPCRFVAGSVPIAPDVQWRDEMSHFRFGLVTLMTIPLLRQYGYTISRSK